MAFSKGERMSNIESLASKVTGLGASVGTWNKIVIGLVAATAIVTALYFVASFITHKKTQALDKAKDEWIAAKDKEQESHIASANKKAAEANKTAAESRERAAIAELRSKELEVKLEQLRLAVADRFIPDSVGKTILHELQKHSGKTVVINCELANTAEPLHFATAIGGIFEKANWKVQLRQSNNTMLPARQGVIINGIGQTNGKIAQFIYNQFLPLGYHAEHRQIEGTGSDLYIQVWAK
jgi:hypothetical protein